MLGVLWVFLTPILLAIVIVATIYRAFSSEFDSFGNYALYTLTGVLFLQYTVNTLSSLSNVMSSNAGTITKIQVPRSLFPVAISASTFLVWVVLMILATVMAFLIVSRSISFLLIVGMLLYCTFLSGVGLCAGAMQPRFPDVGHLIPFSVQLLTFLTPIFYPPSIWPDSLSLVLQLNPFYLYLQMLRAGLGGTWMSLSDILLGLLLAVVSLVVGSWAFNRNWAANVARL